MVERTRYQAGILGSSTLPSQVVAWPGISEPDGQDTGN